MTPTLQTNNGPPSMWETKPLRFSSDDFIGADIERGRGSSRLDREVWRAWEAANAAGLLNYNPSDIHTKIPPGKYGLVLQLNPNRATKRRKPLPFTKVREPMNNAAFNFNKIKDKEVLFNFVIDLKSSSAENSVAANSAPPVAATLEGSVIVNTAPICPGHCLLLPFPAVTRPQVMDQSGLRVGVALSFLSNSRSLRIAFNSMCAYASVNHFHFHAYYLPHRLHVETARCERVAGPCYRFTNHHAPGFVFQATRATVSQAVSNAMKLIDHLISEDIPHNVYITRGAPLDAPTSTSDATRYNSNGASASNSSNAAEQLTHGGAANGSVSNGTASADGKTSSPLEGDGSVVRICVWARTTTAGLPDSVVFAVAVCELAGHVAVYSEEHWEELSEAAIVAEAGQACSLPHALLLPKVKTMFPL